MQAVLRYLFLTLLSARLAYTQPPLDPPPPQYTMIPPEQHAVGVTGPVPLFDHMDCQAIIDKIPALEFHLDRQGSYPVEGGKLVVTIPRNAHRFKLPMHIIHRRCEAVMIPYKENTPEFIGFSNHAKWLGVWRQVKESLQKVYHTCIYDETGRLALKGHENGVWFSTRRCNKIFVLSQL